MKKHLRKIAILLTVCMCLPLFAACDINSLLGNQQPSVSTDVKDEKDDTEAPEIQDDELPEGLELKLGKDNNSYKVEKYKGDAEDIEIPASYNGFPVTEIGPRAFDNSKKLISVVIPDSVEIIADSAFKNCKNLEYVVIGEYESMLRKIDKQAFHGCEMLDLIEFVGYEDTWNDIEKAKDWDKNVGKKTDDKTYELIFIDPTEPPVETQPVYTEPEYTEPEYTDIFGSETEEVSRPSDETEVPSIDIPSDISLAFPALGTITTKHDPSLQVWFPTVGAYMVHLGIDIAAVTSNYDVYAAADGVVEKVWYDADYGWSVAINHGYATTYYKSLQIASNTVVAGDTVTAGQIIAQMGDSSSVEKNDGIHLHFELEISEELVDPIKHFLNIPTVEPEIPDDDETIWEPDVETETETWVDIEDETEFVCAHADYDYNEICDFCGEFIGHKCYDNDANYRCDFCDAMLEHVCVNDNNDLYCDLCGAEMTHACIDNDRDYKCDLCQAVCPPAADSTLTISEAIELGSLYDRSCHSTDKFFVTGTIVEIQNTTYGNLYIQDDEGNRLYIYGVYSEDGSVRFGNMDPMPKVGDIVTLYGIIGCYSEAQMKNVFVVRHDILDVPEAPEEPVEPEEHVHSYSSDYVWDNAKQKYVGSCVTCGKKLEQSMLYFSEPGTNGINHFTIEQMDGCIRYTNSGSADPYIHLYTSGRQLTGKYVVVKYRVSKSGLSYHNSFVGSANGTHKNTAMASCCSNSGAGRSGSFVYDGENWQYLVIEAKSECFVANDDGTYSFAFLRLGGFSGFEIGDYIEVDELAFADNRYAADIYILGDAATCAHDNATYVWNSERQLYVVACGACGAESTKDMVYKTEGTTTVSQVESAGNFLTTEVIDGVVRYTPTKTFSYQDYYFYPLRGNTQVTGKYLVIKYRVVNNGVNMTTGSFYASSAASGQSGARGSNGDNANTALNGTTLYADGEWHYLIITPTDGNATFIPNADGTYTWAYLRMILHNFQAFDGSCYFEIDEIAFADRLGVAEMYANGGECATHTCNDWQYVSNEGTEYEGTRYAVQRGTCSICGNTVTRAAVIAFYFDSVATATSTGASAAITNFGSNGGAMVTDLDARVTTQEAIYLRNNQFLMGSGWIGVNGEIDIETAYYRILDAEGNVLLDWTAKVVSDSSNSGTRPQVKPETTGSYQSVQNQLTAQGVTDFTAYGLRTNNLNVIIDGIDYSSTDTPICIEYAVKVAGAPEGSDLIRVIVFQNVYKYPTE